MQQEVETAQEVRWGLSYAVGYFQLGMLDESWEELRRLPDEYQERAEVLSLRGQILLTQEKWEAVVDHCTWASQRFPDIPEFYIQAALAFDRLGQPDEARSVWLAAPKSIRVTPFYHYNLARCEARLGHFALARQHVRAVMTLAPAMKEVLSRDPGLMAFVPDPLVN